MTDTHDNTAIGASPENNTKSQSATDRRVRPRRPKALGSLRSKFSLFVLAATLITTLVVSLISTHATREFLHSRVEQKLPSLLKQTAEKVTLWYDQRLHEISVFASATTLIGAITEYIASGQQRSREEAERFLGYLLENSPQFSALFVLGNDQQPIVWVGPKLTLPKEFLGDDSMTNSATLSKATKIGDRTVQIAASPLLQFQDKKLGTLNAVLTMDSLEQHLNSSELSDSALMFLVDGNGAYIAANAPLPTGYVSALALPAKPQEPVLTDYKSGDQHLVGSALFVPGINSVLVVEESYTKNFAPVVNIFWRTLAINLGIALLFSIGAYRIAMSISRPIEALSKGVQQIAAGKTDVLITETSSNDEINLLTRAFNTMTARLHEKTKALKKLSVTDGLTGLYNHRFFQLHLSRQEEIAKEDCRELALILCDIDNFKKWNDRLGHGEGDKILENVAEVLKRHSRKSDIVARYGGDEFVILAPNTKLEMALELAEQLRRDVANKVSVSGEGGATTSISISVGVATFTKDSKTLFNDADRALYLAKKAGRNCVRATGIKYMENVAGPV